MTHSEIQKKHKAQEKAEAQHKNDQISDANSIETTKGGNRGASPEEMLRLIARAEEKEFDQDLSKSKQEHHNWAERESISDLGDKTKAYRDLMARIESEAVAKAKDRSASKAERHVKAEIQDKERIYEELLIKAENERQARNKAEKKAESCARAKAQTEKKLQVLTRERAEVEKKLQAEVRARRMAEQKAAKEVREKVKILTLAQAQAKAIAESAAKTKAKRSKFAFISVLVVILAIAFTMRLMKTPPLVVGNAMTVPQDKSEAVIETNAGSSNDTQTMNPNLQKMLKLTVSDGYNQENNRTLLTEGKIGLVRLSDNNRLAINHGTYVSYAFSNISIPIDAVIKSVVIHIEHFEEELFTPGKLKWSIGIGWPTKSVRWAQLNAPLHEAESHEAIDAWDITSILDTPEKINSFQLQVKNNDNVAHRKTLIDNIYMVVEWD